MHSTTVLVCTKCGDGLLTMKWMTEAYSRLTDWGMEYDADSWVEMINQTCKCKFDLTEMDALEKAAENKMIEEYNVWMRGEVIQDDLLSTDIEVMDSTKDFPDMLD